MKSFLFYAVMLVIATASSMLDKKPAYTAYVFMGTECPISQKYIPTLNQMDKAQPQLDVIGVFSGHVTSEQLAQFVGQFKVEFKVMVDPDFELADRLNAAVTPEVFLVDQGGDLHYSGAIDNWFVSLGRNRFEPSEHYLLDAIMALESDLEIKPSRTPAVGCFLERQERATHAHH